MSFDPTQDFIKERGISSGIRYIQNGVIYNAAYVEIGKAKGYADAVREPGADTAKTAADKLNNNNQVQTPHTVAGDVLADAAAKLNSTGLGVTPIVPKEIAEARRENAAAAAAEEHAV